MWNERYAAEEYIYGTEPNDFLAENAWALTGPILSLAEGEGRNAVYLASRGLDVLGVDSSDVGLAKARALAAKKRVKIKTEVADLGVYVPKENHFLGVVSIFAHLPGSIRARLYPLIELCMKPAGLIMLEAYSENQLPRDTGGPKDIDMLMSEDKIRQGFPHLETILLREIERDVREGNYHTGKAMVIQYIGKKKGIT